MPNPPPSPSPSEPSSARPRSAAHTVSHSRIPVLSQKGPCTQHGQPWLTSDHGPPLFLGWPQHSPSTQPQGVLCLCGSPQPAGRSGATCAPEYGGCARGCVGEGDPGRPSLKPTWRTWSIWLQLNLAAGLGFLELSAITAKGESGVSGAREVKRRSIMRDRPCPSRPDPRTL